MPATSWTNVTCPTDQYVVGFNTYVRTHTGSSTAVLARIRLDCRRANAQLEFTGSMHSPTPEGGAPATGGTWVPASANCPSTHPIANGVDTRAGWYVDRMRLRCAQPRPTIPTITFPRWNSTDPSDNTAHAAGWAVRVNVVSSATEYQTCLRRSGTSNCYSEQTFSASGAYVANNEAQFGVTIGSAQQGTITEVEARACVGSLCSPWSAVERMTIVPFAPNLSSPADNVSATSRNVTFSWQANPAATAGYQLFIQRPNAYPAYSIYNPSAASVPGQFLNIQLNAGTTNQTVQIPAELGNSVVWGVAGCANFTGKGRRCSTSITQRTLSLPAAITFTQDLAETFKHARCVNCHAVTTTGYPAGHQSISNPTSPAACTFCHPNSYLPQGALAVEWHAPPSSMSFTGKTDAELCILAKNPGTKATSVQQHLTEDRLILWAVDNPRVQNATLPKAWAGNIQTWRNTVTQWVNAGMPC
jgi:hypothetical protein